MDSGAGWTGEELIRALWSVPEIGSLLIRCIAGCEMEWSKPMIGRPTGVVVRCLSGGHGSGMTKLARNANVGGNIDDDGIMRG